MMGEGYSEEELRADAEEFANSLGQPKPMPEGTSDPTDVNDAYIATLIERATAKYDTDAARELMWLFWSQAHNSKEIHPRLSRHFAECFFTILNERKPAAKALHIEGEGFGSKIDNRKTERDRQLSQMVLMFIGPDPTKPRRGAVKAALEKVVDATGYSIDTVRGAHKMWRRPNLEMFEHNGNSWPAIQQPPAKRDASTP